MYSRERKGRKIMLYKSYDTDEILTEKETMRRVENAVIEQNILNIVLCDNFDFYELQDMLTSKGFEKAMEIAREMVLTDDYIEIIKE